MKKILFVIVSLSFTITSFAQVVINENGIAKPIAVAINQDSTSAIRPPDSTIIDSVPPLMDTPLHRVDPLFPYVDERLPDVGIHYNIDDIFEFVRTYGPESGRIYEVLGDGTEITFTLCDDYWGTQMTKRKHEFAFAKEFVLTDSLDVIVLFSKDTNVFYACYCSYLKSCNMISYLVECDEEGNGYKIFEFQSRKGEDAALFNYTLDNVNRISGNDIFPINDLSKLPKKTALETLATIGSAIGSGAVVLALFLLMCIL